MGGVLGAVNSAVMLVLLLVMSGGPYWLVWTWLALAVFAIVRPWMLSVELNDGGIRIRSWFRVYRFAQGEIVAIDPVPVYSMGIGAGVQFVPFVGALRMLTLQRKDGKETWLPVTLGRRNSVLRLARVLRGHMGLSEAHASFSRSDM